MTSYIGTPKAILQRKAQDIVRVYSRQYHVDLFNKMMTLILQAIDNPAYQAAMITALKTSSTIEKIKNEIQNPSFSIPGVDFIDTNDIPAKYTRRYQVSDSFITNNNETILPENTENNVFNELIIKKDTSIISRLVLPQ